MAIDAEKVKTSGKYSLYKWVLTSADDVANPVPTPLGHRPDKSIKVYGTTDATGWNTATLQIHGDFEEGGSNFLALHDISDTNISLTNSNRIVTILDNCLWLKPVRTAGAFGATGVEIWLLCASANARLY